MKDYSHLEGKIIGIKERNYVDRVLIVGVDPDVGITLVDADDKENYFYCMLGPVAYKAKYGKMNPERWDTYEEEFSFVANMLEDGIFDWAKVRLFFEQRSGSIGSHPSSKTCGFNQ